MLSRVRNTSRPGRCRLVDERWIMTTVDMVPCRVTKEGYFGVETETYEVESEMFRKRPACSFCIQAVNSWCCLSKKRQQRQQWQQFKQRRDETTQYFLCDMQEYFENLNSFSLHFPKRFYVFFFVFFL
jgi:hypothetical protein